MFTGIYGPTTTFNRHEFWDKLHGVRARWQGLWVVGGHFNVIRFVHEKNSGGRITKSMRDFDGLVRSARLRDSPLSNAKFTWMNNQSRLVLSTLDRFLVSRDWEDAYPFFFQKVLPKVTSNHWPVMLHTNAQSFGSKPFRFENMWTTHHSFRELIHC